MKPFYLNLAIIGLVAFILPWGNYLSKKLKISYPILLLLLGALAYWLLGDLWVIDLQMHQNYILHATEFMVIISLMGVGLSIDRPFSVKGWKVPLLLVSLTMVLVIAATTFLGYWFLELGLASALLLGASLAPTDPVLATDVQVGPPNDPEQSRVKFTLSAEAGLNDGAAFPFVWMAIALSFALVTGEPWLSDWIKIDLIYKLLAGLVAGFGLGKLITYLFFTLPEKIKALHLRIGLVALASTFLVYGLTELVGGYGFIAVFVAAITLRNDEIQHAYHKTLHEFIQQIEHTLLSIILVLFAGSLVNGILGGLTWPIVIVAIVLIFLIRPLLAFPSLIGYKMKFKRKLAIAFYGIKGIGSFFYLAYGLEKGNFSESETLWALVAFTVLLSIVLHGLTARFVIPSLRRK